MKTILVANRKGGCGKTMTAITLASALASDLAQGGGRVGLADADRQKSSLRWLKLRPREAARIEALDWTKSGDLGEAPKGIDWLVIDAPGALKGGKAEALIAEAQAVIAPVLPSFFDADSTKRFLKEVEDIKRVRKGKVGLHLLANRVRPRQRSAGKLQGFFDQLGQAPLAWITERAAYGDLAGQGLAVFDKPQRAFAPLRDQWHPVLAVLG